MKQHLYWNVFKALEREVLILADMIFIDEKQLCVYSMKIADLLVRTAIEIESISKELYFQNGGSKENENNLYFDTDCLNYLDQLWKTSAKTVLVYSPYFYLSQENRMLHPLRNAHKRGKGDWKKAYQAIKHNRAENLSKGTIFNLLKALAALFVLNIYLQNQVIDLGKDSCGRQLNPCFGSDIFSVKVHSFPGIDASGRYKKSEEYDQCLYLIQASEGPKEKLRQVQEKINQQIIKQVLERLEKEQDLKELDDVGASRLIKQYSEALMIPTLKANADEFGRAVNALTYEAILNKHQY